MSELVDGMDYKIKFYNERSNSIVEELGSYDKDLGCFFLDGNESVGIDIDCVEEWEGVV